MKDLTVKEILAAAAEERPSLCLIVLSSRTLVSLILLYTQSENFATR